MHIIVDCDDVLLSWIDGFRQWLPHTTTPDHGPDSWSLAKWLGVSDATCLEWIAEFNASPSFGQLHPIPGAVEAVTALHAAGHQITVLTSCSSEPNIVDLRSSNLQYLFGDSIDRVICLDLGESKRKWLNVLRTGVWIEDNYKNAMLGLDAGNKTFMMRRSHNRDDEPKSHRDIVWVDDWSPILSLFS